MNFRFSTSQLCPITALSPVWDSTKVFGMCILALNISKAFGSSFMQHTLYFKTNAYCTKNSMNIARTWSSLFGFFAGIAHFFLQKRRFDLSLFLKEQIALFALFKRAIRLRCLYKKSDLLSFAFL